MWVYLVALAPGLLYAVHDIRAPMERERLQNISRQYPEPGWKLRNLQAGMTKATVVEFLGPPYNQPRRFEGGGRWEFYRYTDGTSDVYVYFEDDVVRNVVRHDPPALADQSSSFATLFQNVYLRLGVFFGCIGIFANLFRGEMLDKSLHYYLLTPMRREVLVAGKFLAGLLAMSVIFTCGTVLQFSAMLSQFDHATVAAFLSGDGSGMQWSYVGVTLLACVTYGSLFIALGLLFRNPVVPAAFVLMWEGILLFMPVTLKQFSIIYYLQSLCPVAARVDSTMPPMLRLLVAGDSTPESHGSAILTLAIISAVCLGVAAFRGRRLEINYGVE